MQENKESEILISIRESENASEEMLKKALAGKDAIIKSAQKEANDILSSNAEEIKKAQERKISELGVKSDSIRKERIEEGRKEIRQLEAKAEKNLNKAVEFIMAKLEEMM
ncbi:MAG: hypothetical protein AABX34_06490 [Nanoarchaeota archaeon]